MRRRFHFSSRRRRASNASSIGQIIWLVSVTVLGAYLLVAGIVRAIACTARAAQRRSAAPAASPGARAEPRLVSLLQIEPEALDDPTQRNAMGRAAFDAWLRGVPSAPRRGADLVRDVRVELRTVGVLETEIAQRRLRWEAAPCTARQLPTAPPLDIERMDPWNLPPNLRGESEHVAVCWGCRGEGIVACGACAGSARLACRDCGGAGKYEGHAANGARRLLNCKECRGKGTRTCDTCKRGRVECATCLGAKRLTAWLVVDETVRTDRQSQPDDTALARVDALEELARDGRAHEPVVRRRAIALADLPASIPAAWRADAWPKFDAFLLPSERATLQSLWVIDVPVLSVEYVVGRDVETVSFEGLRALAPPPGRERLFARRARRLGRAKVLLAALPVAIFVAYAARGRYFLETPTVGSVGAAAIALGLAGLCGYAALWYGSLRRRAWRGWAIGALAPLAIGATALAQAEPSRGRARDAIAEHRLADARRELAALDDDTADLWADLRAQQALDATSCRDAAAAASRIAPEHPKHGAAIAHADALAIESAQRSLAAGDAAAATDALACATEAGARPLRPQIALLAARACLTAKDWACARDRAAEAQQLGAADAAPLAADVDRAIAAEIEAAPALVRTESSAARRAQLAGDALALWTSYAQKAGAAVPPSIAWLRTAKTRDDQVVAREAVLERQRAEVERRRAAAEAARVEAAAERQRQREAREAAAAELMSRPVELYCNDGSTSPCGCNRSSFRGCCSHHGGIEGCHR